MVRTVRCSSCATSFPVDPRKVPEEGVYARCSACDAVFFVAADEATSDPGLPSEVEPAGSVSSEPAEPAASEPTGIEAEGAPSE